VKLKKSKIGTYTMMRSWSRVSTTDTGWQATSGIRRNRRSRSLLSSLAFFAIICVTAVILVNFQFLYKVFHRQVNVGDKLEILIEGKGDQDGNQNINDLEKKNKKEESQKSIIVENDESTIPFLKEGDMGIQAKNELHSVNGLSCENHGGPRNSDAEEMVYWRDIPSDSTVVSPFKRDGEEQFLLFEYDDGGWNNCRMAFESILAMAHAMGRTLVIPPAFRFFMMDNVRSNA